MASQRTATLGAIIALLVGCSTAASQSIQAPATRVRSAAVDNRASQAGSHQRRSRRIAANPVEESLRGRGISFDTDGSARSLFAHAREKFWEISAERATGGDLLFFDLGTGCGGQVGLVETVEPTGRIGFRERRDGDVHHSYVTPRSPLVRRDGRGRILNTFLRPKRVEDPAETRYFAGEMLCAVFRVRAP